MEKRKIILDTDIGDDIDDALALALALEMPQIELLGITTVFLDTQKRARIARKMLRLWGVDVPVYAGIRRGEKMSMSVDSTPCQYTRDLETGEYEAINDTYADGGMGAVDFLVDSARKYGRELTIIAIGPLSNVAEAIRRSPEAMKGIDRILLMGGCFYGDTREWNILCDPRGADVVFGSGIETVCVGLDVTRSTQLNDEQQKRIMSGGQDAKRGYLSDLVRLHWQANGKNAILHDPLTVYYAAHPDILTVAEATVKVDTDGEDTAGRTVNLDREGGGAAGTAGNRLRVGQSVHAEQFLDAFLELVFPGEKSA